APTTRNATSRSTAISGLASTLLGGTDSTGRAAGIMRGCGKRHRSTPWTLPCKVTKRRRISSSPPRGTTSAGFARFKTSSNSTRSVDERVRLDPLRKAKTALVRARRCGSIGARGAVACRGRAIGLSRRLARRPLSCPRPAGFRDRRDLDVSERGDRLRALGRSHSRLLWRAQRLRQQYRSCGRGVALMTTPLLEARAISRRFGHVRALDGADFAVHAGEICALIGDNGAGKSTLVKILSGADRPDDGRILLAGQPVTFNSPNDAQARGVATVYQDLALASDLPPFENLFLGREIMMPGLMGRLGFVNRAAMRRLASEHFERLGVRLRSARTPVSSLSGGQRQSVAIARAAMWADRVILMDEPTAALGVVQTGRVLDLIRQVRDQGIAVVLISHNMPQVLAVADRIEVLRLGRRVAQFAAQDANVDRLVMAMTSGSVEERVT